MEVDFDFIFQTDEKVRQRSKGVEFNGICAFPVESRADQGQHPCQGGAPVSVIKRQLGYTKVNYRGLAKNTVNLITLFAMSNLWMVRKRQLNMREQERVRPKA